MEMFNPICVLALLIGFVYLFFRQDEVDKHAMYRKDLEGDLYILREMRKFYLEHQIDTMTMDDAIEEIAEKVKKIK
ncbi:hypothetical protein HUK80_13400 [Flavobacterium sp. MAH-1]|uniref:Uncharacterized protein n=1 Tax=Flavobacterium agri TaxID=2743471 RepID=A0A7Y8Y3I9_9FLAO|nr:hypothetical protein [Flavobacterium agri]NUY81894.1 hypothetical protein [Flavobacterium agri]NYA71918.1 hypothetical protein [Flavobacterium agri]